MSLTDKLNEKEQQSKEAKTAIWRPSEGETIEGTITELGSTITMHGDAEFATVETDKGEKFTIFLNANLQDQLDELNAEVGDRIAIKFVGLVPTKNKKRHFKKYIAVVEKPTETE